jgi:hypothetical protein
MHVGEADSGGITTEKAKSQRVCVGSLLSDVNPQWERRKLLSSALGLDLVVELCAKGRKAA